MCVLRFIFLLFCFSLFLADLSAKEESPKKIITKSGLEIVYLEVSFEGEYLALTLPNGKMKLPVQSISEESMKILLSSDSKPTPTAPPSPLENKLKLVDAPLPQTPLETTGLPVITESKQVATTYRLPTPLTLEIQPDWPEINSKVKISSATVYVESNTYDQQKVKVDVRIPLINGVPGPNAHHIVFHAPYPTQTVDLDHDYHLFYPKVLGFTIFSFSMQTKNEEFADPKKCYWYSESGWHEVVFTAQKAIQDEYKLQPQKLLITTESAGSNMSQRMALENPDKIRAVALYGGGDYAEVKEYSPVAWLVLHGRSDSTVDPNLKLTEQLKASGSDFIYTATAPDYLDRGSSLYYHIPSKQSRSMQAAFLWAIATNPDRDIPGKRKELWPYLSSLKDHSLIFENIPAHKDKIQPQDVCYLPGAAFAALWLKNPNSLQAATLSSDLGSASTMALTPPAGTLIKGFVIYGADYGFTNYPRTVEDMHSLANAGYFVIASKSFKSTPQSREIFISALSKWKQSEPRLASLPTFFVGYGQSGFDTYKKLNEKFSWVINAMALSEVSIETFDSENINLLKNFAIDQPLLMAEISDSRSKKTIDEILKPKKKSTLKILTFDPINEPAKNAELFINETKTFFDSTFN